MSKLIKSIQKICDLYVSGLSSEKLAIMFNVTPAAIKYHLKRNNIPRRLAGFQKGNNYSIKYKKESDLIINCLNCKQTIKIWKCLKETRKYCSVKCYRANKSELVGHNHPRWKGGLPNCKDCGKRSTYHYSNNNKHKVCHNCSLKFRSGKNHWNFKHGKSKKWRREVNFKEYRRWRKQVLIRDNHKCVRCSSEKQLHAHHKIEWSKNINLRYVVSNGETLCRECHEQHHKFKFRSW